MNFPSQNLKKSIHHVAQKFGVSQRTAQRYLQEVGASKSREQYESDAQSRRKIAFDLRQKGFTWKDIGTELGISAGNARVLACRYKKTA